MRRYQRVVRETVRADRFDNPSRPPKGVKKTGHPRAPFVIESGLQTGSLVPVELGDWVVHFGNGAIRVLNHERFLEQFKEIKDIDGEDVTDQYRPAKRKELDDEEHDSKGSADAEVSSKDCEGQDEIHPEGEAQGS